MPSTVSTAGKKSSPKRKVKRKMDTTKDIMYRFIIAQLSKNIDGYLTGSDVDSLGQAIKRVDKHVTPDRPTPNVSDQYIEVYYYKLPRENDDLFAHIIGCGFAFHESWDPRSSAYITQKYVDGKWVDSRIVHEYVI